MKPGAILLCTCVILIGTGAATNERSEKSWWDYGGGPAASSFIELDQIKKSNVGKLEVAWFYPHGATGFNPIVVDDLMYVLYPHRRNLAPRVRAFLDFLDENFHP